MNKWGAVIVLPTGSGLSAYSLPTGQPIVAYLSLSLVNLSSALSLDPGNQDTPETSIGGFSITFSWGESSNYVTQIVSQKWESEGS